MHPQPPAPRPSPRPSRRTLLAGAVGAGAALAVTAPTSATATTPPTARRGVRPDAGLPPATTDAATEAAVAEIAALETTWDRRIGVLAQDLRTGRAVAHRADETFAMCSTFKTYATAALLDGRLVVPDRTPLRRRVPWPPSLVAGAGYAPRLAAWQADGYVPTLAEVAEVTLADSDNAGANLLMQLTGGPASVTRLLRDLGDDVSTLTRWEPDLNTWSPGQAQDASSPRASGASHAALLVGRGLPRRERDLLRRWMLGNRTGGATLRAGLPAGWTIAEKTGSGAWGTRNDVGVAWRPDGSPVLLSCLTNGPGPDARSIDEPLRDVARICARALG